MGAAPDVLITSALDQLVRDALALERARSDSLKVDGQIIGTGQSDFTQGNTLYALTHQSRTFQLMDVPGIEGDESRFAPMVKEAVAKAHLVFYVNGTNKKPEAATVIKIRDYLGRGSNVCSLINVRGSADAYEFVEDRIDLERHGAAVEALCQTEAALAAALNPARLLPGQYVQGLLGFAALALDSDGRTTTIHTSRAADLGVQQRNYLRAFGSADAMRSFSRIDVVAGVLLSKLSTFREDIIEANKAKVLELLSTALAELDDALKDHEAFLDRVRQEFDTARSSVEEALETFSDLSLGLRRNEVGLWFNRLDQQAQDVVSEHFDEGDQISRRLEQAFREEQQAMVRRLEDGLVALLGTLESSLQQAVLRLVQDLQRADLHRRAVEARFSDKSLDLKADMLDASLGLGGWLDLTLKVAVFALAGAEAGSLLLPAFGTVVGAVVGLVVGLLMGMRSLATSKASRIRKVQALVMQRLGSARAEALSVSDKAHLEMVAGIRNHVESKVLGEIAKLQQALDQPRTLVEEQIALMRRILQRVEHMPYGTVQAIHV